MTRASIHSKLPAAFNKTAVPLRPISQTLVQCRHPMVLHKHKQLSILRLASCDYHYHLCRDNSSTQSQTVVPLSPLASSARSQVAVHLIYQLILLNHSQLFTCIYQLVLSQTQMLFICSYQLVLSQTQMLINCSYQLVLPQTQMLFICSYQLVLRQTQMLFICSY